MKGAAEPLQGYVHSLESFGSADGPGIRYIVFLRGCAMRCRYCHNADTWIMRAEDAEKGVVTADGERVFPKAENLQDQLMTADEILSKALRYRNYWGDRGGITVSGGEPMLQMPFVTELFRKAKELGVNTCLDTAGQPFRESGPVFNQAEELMQYTDLVLLDIKHIDPVMHRRLTGQPNDNILVFARWLDSIGKPVWIRHVLVEGYTDDDGYLEETADFLGTLHNVKRIDVLPYHTMGIYKWKELGIPYTLSDAEPPSPERVRHAEEILRRAIWKS